jgi:hypothetical protein
LLSGILERSNSLSYWVGLFGEARTWRLEDTFGRGLGLFSGGWLDSDNLPVIILAVNWRRVTRIICVAIL